MTQHKLEQFAACRGCRFSDIRIWVKNSEDPKCFQCLGTGEFKVTDLRKQKAGAEDV